ncbi:hypothetical protein DEJ46_38940 [Streptomyces venezuelae]|uniref:Uncharacterized protein n=1 Tax=Streptomyces venezuelae TaxID=54571 RepID=A0A5P2B2X9_STRVZ|nr:hypothetical protein DEJ46_38940 [Streptomyces venezuelae]
MTSTSASRYWSVSTASPTSARCSTDMASRRAIASLISFSERSTSSWASSVGSRTSSSQRIECRSSASPYGRMRPRRFLPQTANFATATCSFPCPLKVVP